VSIAYPHSRGRFVVALIAVLAAGGCSHLVMLHDPLSAAEHNDLGVAYERSGEVKLAASEYRKALGINPRLVRPRVNLGNLSAGAGRWEEAARHYRRALRDSSDADAMNNLAVALLRLKNPGEARTWAEKAVALGGPSDSVYRATLDEVRAAGK
jgi:Flp pilus assembly protein TadD